MRAEILTLALIVGACTWAFRFFPTRMDVSALPEKGALARFLASTGPAAIATLFVASVLPEITRGKPLGPFALGSLAILAVYWLTRSVVGATLAGSVAFGVALAILAR